MYLHQSWIDEDNDFKKPINTLSIFEMLCVTKKKKVEMLPWQHKWRQKKNYIVRKLSY